MTAERASRATGGRDTSRSSTPRAWLDGAMDALRGFASAPARIMVPRVLFLATSIGLVLFGLLMIYSSSSIVGLTTRSYDYDPTYFLVHQAEFAGAGVVLAIGLALVDYRVWSGTPLRVLLLLTVLMLAVVYTPMAGRDAFGATRWIAIGPFSLQPSEFAKVTILLVGAQIAHAYFTEGSLGPGEAAKLAFGGICVPLALVLWQPDKGTTGVLGITLLIMCFLAGMSVRHIAVAGVACLAFAAFYALKDDYSRARVLTMLNPFSDPYGAGYQLTQGFYALGSGGITGMGLGFSRQKYGYLPMSHNDFIFAIVGEELGFIGAFALLAAFGLLLWSGLKIAENASDGPGRLIAAGCTSLIIVQLLLNVSGVLGVFPLSGKPVPFVSYGGSSVMSCLLLVGLVMSVSLRSTLPETAYDRRRARMRLAEDSRRQEAQPRRLPDRLPEPMPVPVVREPSASAPLARRGWRVVEGGAPRAARGASAVRPRTSALVRGGYERVDLGPSASDRLRGARDDGRRRS